MSETKQSNNEDEERCRTRFSGSSVSQRLDLELVRCPDVGDGLLLGMCVSRGAALAHCEAC